MSKPIIAADKMYKVLVSLAEHPGSHFDFTDAEHAALRKVLRCKYARPAAVAQGNNGARPYITRYEVTAEGRDFLSRVSS